jgi:hypothetical protein
MPKTSEKKVITKKKKPELCDVIRKLFKDYNEDDIEEELQKYHAEHDIGCW